MLALAQFVMRGPLQASGVAALAFAFPLLFWLGAAVVALVTLRLELRTGLNIALWALIPAVTWLFLGLDPAPLNVLLLTLLMAGILQTTASWERALLAGALLAAVLGHLIPSILPAMTEQLVDMGVSLLQQVSPEVTEELGDNLEPLVKTMMLGIMAATHFFMAILSTLLARGWQARLYNPGGLQREFHDFRLSGPAVLASVLLMAFAPYLGVNPAIAALVFGMPLVFAGIALVHGVVARRAMGNIWLVAFYASAFILGPNLLLMLIFVAIIDSWLDLRNRVKTH